MSWFWINWLMGAVLLCWAVGAYNRLVRLRSACTAAFAVLAGCWAQQVAWREAGDDAAAGESAANAGAAERQPTAANQQLVIALASAKSQPLSHAAIAALSMARAVAVSAWQAQAHTRAAPASPADLQARGLQRLALEGEQALEAFNAAALQYNRARSQWPTGLVAALFNFAPAKGL